MNGNNGNNGNNGSGNNNGWQRVHNQNNNTNYGPSGYQNGPFSGNQNNGPNGPNNQNGPFSNPMGGQWAPPHENSGGHGNRHNPSSIFDFVFYIIGLSVEITFKAFELVFQVIGEVFGGRRKYTQKDRAQYSYQYDREKNGYTKTQSNGNSGMNYDPSKTTYKEAKQTYKEEKRAYKEERKEQKAEMKEERKTYRTNDSTAQEPEVKETKLSLVRKDGLLMLFLGMTIPLIVLVAMKLIIPAAVVLGGGVLAMAVFNGVMTGVINRKEKKESAGTEEDSEENSAEDGSSEIEKVMEAAFDKVFEIRKDMILIPDGVVKDKIESICSISEKIIGEVRSTPEIYPQSKRFFYYNLDSFNEIFNKYVKLLNYREDSPETNRTLFETEKAFGNIEQIFKDILTKVLERDLINLKAEINVMKGSQ